MGGVLADCHFFSDLPAWADVEIGIFSLSMHGFRDISLNVWG